METLFITVLLFTSLHFNTAQIVCCSKYIMLPTNMTEDDTFTYVMDQDYLDEGYYQLQAKLAMVTRFPKLVDLDGKGLVVQVKEAGSST